jgi:hypothetical protein
MVQSVHFKRLGSDVFLKKGQGSDGVRSVPISADGVLSAYEFSAIRPSIGLPVEA